MSYKRSCAILWKLSDRSENVIKINLKQNEISKTFLYLQS